MFNLDPGVHLDGAIGGFGLVALFVAAVGPAALDGHRFAVAALGAVALGFYGVLFAENVWEYYYPPTDPGVGGRSS